MVKPINDDFSVAGQVTPDELKQVAQDGFKSVLNLQSPDEQGFLKEEPQLADSLGLSYVNAPFTPGTADETQLAAIVAELDKLPKPTLVHCAGGLRASVVALISIAQQDGLTIEQATERSQAAGFDLNVNPRLKQLFEQTIGSTAKDV